ncbi:MAG TPA: four helix bundle protein [Vicinamibacteria bacterium]|jgi:hypothetical protein
MTPELPIIQKVYDLILRYVPILNALPRDHRFVLGDRVTTGLYALLEALLIARYSRAKLMSQLEPVNGPRDRPRHVMDKVGEYLEAGFVSCGPSIRRRSVRSSTGR